MSKSCQRRQPLSPASVVSELLAGEFQGLCLGNFSPDGEICKFLLLPLRVNKN
jgi:hypothetical protein